MDPGLQGGRVQHFESQAPRAWPGEQDCLVLLAAWPGNAKQNWQHRARPPLMGSSSPGWSEPWPVAPAVRLHSMRHPTSNLSPLAWHGSHGQHTCTVSWDMLLCQARRKPCIALATALALLLPQLSERPSPVLCRPGVCAVVGLRVSCTTWLKGAFCRVQRLSILQGSALKGGRAMWRWPPTCFATLNSLAPFCSKPYPAVNLNPKTLDSRLCKRLGAVAECLLQQRELLGPGVRWAEVVASARRAVHRVTGCLASLGSWGPGLKHCKRPPAPNQSQIPAVGRAGTCTARRNHC
jgi:hypothetical protein